MNAGIGKDAVCPVCMDVQRPSALFCPECGWRYSAGEVANPTNEPVQVMHDRSTSNSAAKPRFRKSHKPGCADYLIEGCTECFCCGCDERCSVPFLSIRCPRTWYLRKRVCVVNIFSSICGTKGARKPRVKSKQDPYKELLVEIRSLEKQGKLDECILIVESGLKKYPKDAQLMKALGLCLLKRADASRRNRTNTLEGRSNKKIERKQLSKAHKDIIKAKSWFEKALSSDKNDEKILFSLGLVEERLDNKRRARKLYKKVLKQNPGFTHAATRLTSLESNHKSRGCCRCRCCHRG